MKKVLVLIMLTSFSGFAQQLTYQSGGNVYNSNNEKFKPDEVRELMIKNQKALSLYNAGRDKKTWGNVLLYGGLGLATFNLVSAVAINKTEIDRYGNMSTKKTGPELAIVGGVMVLASIPIKIGFSKKIQASVEEYNQKVVYDEKEKAAVSIVADSYGIGFRVSF